MTDQPSGEVILYQRGDGTTAIEVRVENESVWLSQAQLADLFQTTQQNISLHLKNIYDEGELDEGATHKDFLSVRLEGSRTVERKVAHYNLDGIVGFPGYKSNEPGQLERAGIDFTLFDPTEFDVPGSFANCSIASAIFAAASECSTVKCLTSTRRASTTTPRLQSRRSSLRSCRTSCTSPRTVAPRPR